MEIKKYIIMAVSVMTAVVVFGAVLPVFADTTQANDTFTNTGLYYIVDDSESHTFVFTANGLTVDGDAVTFPTGKEYTLLATNDILLRSTSQGDRLQLRGSLNGSVVSCNLTIANGSVTGSYVNTDSQTVTINQAYTSYWLATSNEQAEIMKDYTGSAYVLGDDSILGRGLTRLMTGANTDVWVYLQINASVDDGVTVAPVEDFTFSDLKVNTTEVNGYEDLYEFQSITFTATHTDSGTTTNVTYSAVIIPSEVTAERSVHPEGATKVLMDLLPVLIGAGLLLGVAGYVIKRRM